MFSTRLDSRAMRRSAIHIKSIELGRRLFFMLCPFKAYMLAQFSLVLMKVAIAQGLRWVSFMHYIRTCGSWTAVRWCYLRTALVVQLRNNLLNAWFRVISSIAPQIFRIDCNINENNTEGFRYRNGDAITATQAYYERVNSHSAGNVFMFDVCGVKVRLFSTSTFLQQKYV